MQCPPGLSRSPVFAADPLYAVIADSLPSSTAVDNLIDQRMIQYWLDARRVVPHIFTTWGIYLQFSRLNNRKRLCNADTR